MESQPQNPEFRINPENFHPGLYDITNQQRTLLNSQLKFKTAPPENIAVIAPSAMLMESK